MLRRWGTCLEPTDLRVYMIKYKACFLSFWLIKLMLLLIIEFMSHPLIWRAHSEILCSCGACIV